MYIIIVRLYIINKYNSCYETIYDHVSDIVIDFTIEYTQFHKIIFNISSIR